MGGLATGLHHCRYVAALAPITNSTAVIDASCFDYLVGGYDD
jgi:hypothetical protein